MESLNQLLEKLVRLPSVNPAFGGPGEGEVQSFVADWLSSRGIESPLQEVDDGRCNVLAFCGSKEKPTLLFEAHMDTVGVAGWKTGSPYQLREEGDRLFGRGSCDTKASLAVFLTLAEAVAKHPEEAKYSLLFAATVDEEYAQEGAYQLGELFEEHDVVAAVTGEPTRSNIVCRHKGACRYRFTSSGKAAHGSTPELGENAILKAAAVLTRLEALAASIDAGPESDMLTRATLNVGEIHGGIGFNVVPDSCFFEVDRRIGINETADVAREQLEKSLEGTEGVELEVLLERPPLLTGDDNWFSEEMLGAAQAIQEDLRLMSVAYMTNAVAYAERGVPALVFGPGNIAQAHKKDEFIEKGEMERSYAILLRLFGLES